MTKKHWFLIIIAIIIICIEVIAIMWRPNDIKTEEVIEDEIIFENLEDLEGFVSDEVKQSSNNEITEFIETHKIYLNDEQLEELDKIQWHIDNVTYIRDYEKYYSEYILIAESVEQQKLNDESIQSNAETQPVSYETYSNPQQEGVLTALGGVNYITREDGVVIKETWYSQRDAPGGGLDIPGRHVEESDGTIRDGDGYIVVAASYLPKGTEVETSLGTGKVYDTGYMGPNHLDIYTNW